jgi:hypothetical protein
MNTFFNNRNTGSTRFYLFPVTAFLLLNFSIYYSASKLKGYELSKPDQRLILPDTLREVSGVCELDSSAVVCVQDENGILFVVDAYRNEVKQQINFGPNGDYEAVTKVGSSIFVLRSDGVLFEVADFGTKRSKTFTHFTNIPATNNEGLCYDQENNRLLIGCKSKPAKGSDARVIYAFDLAKKIATKSPVYTFSVDNIIRFAIQNKINLPTRIRNKTAVPFIRFSTSEIAIHPFSKDLYLLSAADHMLFIFDQRGEISHIEKLDPIIFNKPEGIAFTVKGDMLITNEAQNKKPTLLRFNKKEY